MTVPQVRVYVTFGSVVELTNIVTSVNIKRGRSRQLEQFTSGSATVVFKNSSRILDPLNQSSSVYPNVLPRVKIEIVANSTTIFSGVVVDWNLEYDKSNNDFMVAVCSDNFTVLANQSFDAWTPSSELSGSRISSSLARPEIDFIGSTSISSGSSTLGPYDVQAQTNVLNYLQLVTKSEQGFLYVAADGDLVFKGRADVLNQTANANFSDDGTGIKYQTLSNQFGDELLYNYIVTESPAGGPFIASDSASQAIYQWQQYSITDLLNSLASEVEDLGDYLLGKYKQPVLRFTGLSIQLSALSTANQNICLSLDLTDVCTVKKTFKVGSPLSVTQNVIVSEVKHSIYPDSHVIDFSFEPADLNRYLVLDDSVFGILDSNLLSF